MLSQKTVYDIAHIIMDIHSYDLLADNISEIWKGLIHTGRTLIKNYQKYIAYNTNTKETNDDTSKLCDKKSFKLLLL